jgi:hypothetical protein
LNIVGEFVNTTYVPIKMTYKFSECNCITKERIKFWSFLIRYILSLNLPLNIKMHIFYAVTEHSGPGPPYYGGFTITIRHTTLGRTPMDEGPARRRDLYLKHTTLTRDRHPCPQRDPRRLRQRGHWDSH